MSGAYQTHGPTLRGLGYPIIPVRGKKPALNDWPNEPEAALNFDDFQDHNIGVLCGSRGKIVAVDIDVYDENVSQLLAEKVRDDLGFAPQRIGQAPKTLFVFRTTEEIEKRKTAIFEINGQDCAVEVLGKGQQFVASGIHPETHKKYKWVDDTLLDVTVGNLTEVTPQAIDDFIAEANTLLAAYGTKKGRERLNGASTQPDWFATQELQGKLEEIEAAILHIPNDDWHYDDWVRQAHAIKSAVGDDGYDLFDRWSQRSDKYDAPETERVWNSIGEVHKVGAGSIFYLASEHGFDVGEYRREQKQNAFEDAFSASVYTPEEQEKASDILTASKIVGPVPRREWALDQWFPLKTVGMLFGQGGIGKTLLAQQLANCVAIGDPFMGIEVKQMPVLCVMCEDDATEISRRQLDINQWLEIDEIMGSAPDNCYFWPRVGEDNIVCTFPSQGAAETQEFYGKLCEQIAAIKEQHNADDVLVILDNATDLFGGNENARREVNTFIKSYLGAICQRLNATIVLLAHPSLSGLASGTGMSGSTAWENSVRSRCYMTRDDVIDDLRILSRKKSNYSDISNESDVRLIWQAGALQLPTSPDAIDKIEMRALRQRVLESVSEAWKAKKPFRSKNSNGRKVQIALPKVVTGERTAAVMRVFFGLVSEGEIVHVERKGYCLENEL